MGDPYANPPLRSDLVRHHGSAMQSGLEDEWCAGLEVLLRSQTQRAAFPGLHARQLTQILATAPVSSINGSSQSRPQDRRRCWNGIKPPEKSTIRVVGCSAGADWFSIRKNEWVRIYELTSVKVKVPANYRELELKDSGKRTASIRLMTVQENRDLWDLVYNGILHSVASGNAEVNALARKAFNVARPRERLESPIHQRELGGSFALIMAM